MIRIGILGDIGSGKSYIAKNFLHKFSIVLTTIFWSEKQFKKKKKTKCVMWCFFRLSMRKKSKRNEIHGHVIFDFCYHWCSKLVRYPGNVRKVKHRKQQSKSKEMKKRRI